MPARIPMSPPASSSLEKNGRGWLTKTIRLTSSFSVDEDDVQRAFIPCSGPGSQNVNKVTTVAQLRHDALAHIPFVVFSH